jgi:hypothetical protein
VRTTNVPTIVRGVLFVPPSLLTTPVPLLSIDGRKVMELRPGANDLRMLAPGVYFVAERRRQNEVRASKVILTR